MKYYFMFLIGFIVSAQAQVSTLKIEPTVSAKGVVQALEKDHTLRLERLNKNHALELEKTNIRYTNGINEMKIRLDDDLLKTKIRHENQVQEIQIRQEDHVFDSHLRKQLDYESKMISIYQNINDLMEDRVRWEFHIAAGMYSINNPEAFAGIGLKFNINNPKIVAVPKIKSGLNEIDLYLDAYDYSIEKKMREKVARYNREISQYSKEIFWKRISIGITMPFIDRVRGFTITSRASTNGTLCSTSSYNTSSDTCNTTTSTYDEKDNRSGYQYFFSKMYWNVGYDIADWFTINAGYNLDGEISTALTIDISTPVTSSVNQLLAYLTGEAELSRPSSNTVNTISRR